jgi:hypothetical protein
MTPPFEPQVWDFLLALEIAKAKKREEKRAARKAKSKDKAPAPVSAQTAYRKELVEMRAAGPQPKKKDAMAADAKSQRGLGRRRFEAAWAGAADEKFNDKWGRAGRPKKPR